MTQAAEGSARCSLAEFARAEQVSLVRFAFLLCGDRHPAEDVVQDVLTAMFRRFGETLPLANPAAYARTAVVRANVSRMRRRSAGEVPRGVSAFAERAGEQAGAGYLGGRQEQMWASVCSLPARQRAAVVLRYYEDLTVADVAAVLGCPAGTAASLVSRAVRSLRNDIDLVEGRS